jgi:hypothetical protein
MNLVGRLELPYKKERWLFLTRCLYEHVFKEKGSEAHPKALFIFYSSQGTGVSTPCVLWRPRTLRTWPLTALSVRKEKYPERKGRKENKLHFKKVDF